MKRRAGRVAIWLLAAAAIGCAEIDVPEPQLLAAPRAPERGAVLEIASIKVPWGAASVKEDLWERLDELRIDSGARARLAENGIRMGVAAGHTPTELLELIKSIERAYRSDGGVQLEIIDHAAAELAEATRRNLRSGQRCELIASAMRSRESLLMRDADGGASGRTYLKPQYLFAAELALAPGGSVDLQLTPELQHGEMHLEPAALGAQAVTLQHARSREVFDDLRCTVTLHPGEILAITCRSDQPASFGGRCFRTAAGGDAKQKLLLVRLVQVQHDGLFDDVVDSPEQVALGP